MIPAMGVEFVLQEVRYALRGLVKASAFTATAVLTLALGIGATAAIFSVIDAVILRPLPWSEPSRAAMIWSRWSAFDKTWVATGEVIDYRNWSRSFAAIGAWSDGQINVTGDGEPERVDFAQVTANTFDVLGVRPLLGRVFTQTDDVPNGPRLVVISHALWTQRYGRDASIVGRNARLNGQPYEIVGVMPAGFALPTDYQNAQPTMLWTPLQIDPATAEHGSHGLYAAGRLAPGVSIAQASKELHDLAQAWTREGLYPPQMRFDAFAVSLQDEVLGPVGRAIGLLAAAVAFLLLIACSNVANLMLARAEWRQRDIAVRTALGAGSRRLVAQLLIESLLLSIAGAAIGLALASVGVQALTWLHPDNIPRVGTVDVNRRALLVTMAACVVVTLLSGLFPALRALAGNVSEGLREGRSLTTLKSGQRFRSALVVVQTALAIVLLVGAGLLIRSLGSLQRIDLGFRPDHALTMRISLPAASHATAEAVVGFYGRLLDQVRSLPGVRAAGAVRSLPLASEIGDFWLMVDGYVPPPGTNAKGDWEIVTDGYLEAMGERLVRGRSFTPADNQTGQLVALINEEFVRQYLSGRQALGGRFRLGGPASRPWVTIVGIVANVRHNGVAAPIKEKFYIPHAQWHRSTGNPMRGMTLVVRTAGDPSALAGAVQAEVRRLDPTIPVAEVRTMDEVVARALSRDRFTSALLSVFASLAVALAAVGLFSVLTYTIARRTREFGVRIAMGARPVQVLQLVMRSAFSLALAGLVVGLAMAAGLTRFMGSLLHDVTPLDAWTFGAVTIGVLAVTALASIGPAWRATRVDPVNALRAE